LAEQIVELIRGRILSGDFVSGERLVETRLAADLGTSRGPIREALKQLAAEGLVREEPRRGTFVAAPTLEDARDLYDLRAAIEARAARLSIEAGDAARTEELVVEHLDSARDRLLGYLRTIREKRAPLAE